MQSLSSVVPETVLFSASSQSREAKVRGDNRASPVRKNVHSAVHDQRLQTVVADVDQPGRVLNSLRLQPGLFDMELKPNDRHVCDLPVRSLFDRVHAGNVE